MKFVINKAGKGIQLSPVAIVFLLRKKGYQKLYFYKSYEEQSRYKEQLNCIHYKPICEKEFINDVEFNEDIIITKNHLSIENTLNTGSMIKILQKILLFKNNINYQNILSNREDKDLIELIEYLGENSVSAYNAILKIIELPDDVEYEIYDNNSNGESVHEKHKVWD